ncbi:MAG: hypothetical protein Fur0022_06790 [Anaerolineales bacterium]
MSLDPLIGRQIANFRIERLLGRGGMAVVYYGWDTALERPVALKVIDARFREDPFYTTRFVREARAVAKWQHENIVKIYYAGEEEGLYYFAMEYIAGQDLGKWLSKAPYPLAASEILRIGQAIARALDYAHQQGIIHRDIKPANILISEEGRIVLTDFGLAMDLSQGSVGEAFGSAHYIAPEQARRSADAVPQSDLYSFGVVLFEMLTGRVPFDDPSPTSVALQHITQNVPSPRTFNPDLSPETERVLLKALSKKPEDRYPTGQALMDALAKALQPLRAENLRPITLPPPPARAALPMPPSPLPTELIGLQLDEYRLETLLGQGGMARVYRAIDTKLQRYAAIKVIDTPYLNDADYLARFEREARAIAQLEHPHIVRLYRYGEAQGLLYMAMQFVEGADLGAVMQAYRKDGQWMPFEEVLRIIQEIAAALDYMHTKGVIHRDLTPSNVMLAQDGQAFVADFGLSLLTEVGTRGEIFGSPHYMAPEQAVSSAGVVPQSDLYALGVILYEMLTGRVPFMIGEPLEIAMSHVRTPLPAPRSFRSELSPEVEGVLQKALEKNPKDRYQTGAQFATALETAFHAARTPVHSPAEPPSVPSVPERVAERLTEPPVPPAPGPKPRKRLGLRIAFAVLFLTLVVLGGWYTFVERRIALPGQFPSMGALSTPVPLFTSSPSPTPTPTYPPSKTPEPPTQTLEPIPTATFTQAPSLTPTEPPAPTLTSTTASSPTSAPPTSPTPIPTTPPLITLRELDQMPIVLIPGGTFNMGANPDDALAEMDERPQHPVTLNRFYLDQYEVTISQYAMFLATNGGHAPAACLGLTCVKTSFEALDSHLIWNGGTIYQAEPGFENHPINFVTWYGAQAYCEWVGGRLPTEAEWEYAARGTDARLYPWGSEPPDPTHALFNTGFEALLPVDAFPGGASAFGIWGMAGSLWEWTADWYAEDYYANSPAANPLGPEEGAFRDPRVLRGGGWDSLPEDLRATARQAAEPLNGGPFGANVGFRCAMDAGE